VASAVDARVDGSGPPRAYDVGRSLSTDYFGLRDLLAPENLELIVGKKITGTSAFV
jgi:hypothetical protein